MALSAIVIFAGFLQAQPAVAEELHFFQPHVNLGELRSHVVRSQRFDFVNQGREFVEILSVEPSCGCMAVKLERRHFRPGEQGQLTVDIRPTTQTTGSQAWYAKVVYRPENRPAERRTIHLQLQGVVHNEVTVTPAALAWTGTGSREVTVTDLGAPPRVVTGLHFSSPLIEARVASTDKGVTRIILQASAAIPVGRRDEMLSIYLNDPGFGQLQIPVTLIGQTRAAVTVTPDQVSQQMSAGQPLPSTLVRLRPAGERAVVIQKLATDDPAITCTWAKGPGKEATLRIQVNTAKLGDRELNGAVRVQLREPVEEVLVIPVRVGR